MIVLVGIQTNKSYGYFQPQLDFEGAQTVFRASSFLLQSEVKSFYNNKPEMPVGSTIIGSS